MLTTAHSRSDPSPRYRELEHIYRQVHDEGLVDPGKGAKQVFAGNSLFEHIGRIRQLAKATGARTILDYGSGKGRLYAERNLTLADGTVIPSISEYWGVEAIRCFDPGVPEHAAVPVERFDGVVCTDVLEHIPEEDVPWVLAELFSFANSFVYANIASYPARKTLPNGWNAHVTVREPAWWRMQIHSAAAGWEGSAFEFLVQQRRQAPMFVQKLLRLPKLKSTTIRQHAGKSPGRGAERPGAASGL